MSSNPPNGNGNGTPAAAATQRLFAIQRLYLKDISFEAPNVPAVFEQAGGQPDIKLNLRTAQRELPGGLVEVSLHLSAHATFQDKTVFLVEVDQAGVFQITGYGPDEIRAIIGVACPNTLFPYARETVSTLVQKGGFPPLYLQPIDFATLFASQAQRTAGEA